HRRHVWARTSGAVREWNGVPASMAEYSIPLVTATDDGAEFLTVAGREVRISNPGKPYFARKAKLTKLQIVEYYLSVAGGALNGIRNRPFVLKRFVNGAHAEPF